MPSTSDSRRRWIAVAVLLLAAAVVSALTLPHIIDEARGHGGSTEAGGLTARDMRATPLPDSLRALGCKVESEQAAWGSADAAVSVECGSERSARATLLSSPLIATGQLTDEPSTDERFATLKRTVLRNERCTESEDGSKSTGCEGTRGSILFSAHGSTTDDSVALLHGLVDLEAAARARRGLEPEGTFTIDARVLNTLGAIAEDRPVADSAALRAVRVGDDPFQCRLQARKRGDFGVLFLRCAEGILEGGASQAWFDTAGRVPAADEARPYCEPQVLPHGEGTQCFVTSGRVVVLASGPSQAVAQTRLRGLAEAIARFCPGGRCNGELRDS